MTDQMMKTFVSRFLQWKLPADFSPDNGISFKPYTGPKGAEPVGTNLFTATQAEEMLRSVLGDEAIKPLSTYPEDRATMLALCAAVLKDDDADNRKAAQLADIVQAILRDEAPRTALPHP